MLRTTIVPRMRTQFRSVARLLMTQQQAKLKDKMQAWQIHSYNGLNDLRLCNVTVPMISRSTDVLVEVKAASVNHIDVMMTDGYGGTVLNLMRKKKSLVNEAYGNITNDMELPLTLGRDFAGVIVSKGFGVEDKLSVGDHVWGVVPLEQQGCHANYVMVDSSLVHLCPQGLSFVEAASILYTGLTAWSALWYTGGFCYKTAIAMTTNRRVLVMGGSGGVGTQAIQLLKAWNMHVISTCSTDAVDALQNLGADTVIDYKQDDADARIVAEGPYDIILDCARLGPKYIRTKQYPHNTYITLNAPMLRNIDDHGLVAGTMKNVVDLVKFNIPIAENKSCVKWGYFTPSPTGIDVLQQLVESKKIVPVVQQVYSFEDLPRAYERAKEGHLRGKLVIDME